MDRMNLPALPVRIGDLVEEYQEKDAGIAAAEEDEEENETSEQG